MNTRPAVVSEGYSTSRSSKGGVEGKHLEEERGWRRRNRSSNGLEVEVKNSEGLAKARGRADDESEREKEV